MRNEQRLQAELERNIKYLEDFKADLKKLLELDEEITDFQNWSDLVAKKSSVIVETAHKIDTLKFVLDK